MKHIIKTQDGLMVSGFSRKHQCVQFTTAATIAKTFRSLKAAFDWAEKYVGGGYGFSEFTIVEA